MDPSEEKKDNSKPVSRKKTFFLPGVLIALLLLAIGGALLFLNSSSEPTLTVSGEDKEKQPVIEASATHKEASKQISTTEKKSENDILKEENFPYDTEPGIIKEPVPEHVVRQKSEEVSVCFNPKQHVKSFYNHLDKQPYMKAYHLTKSSQEHFMDLIDKLLANPPEVTREADDLYTILKNTAHFFRISGKDNILMLKGILNSEKDKLEDILAAYYFLITTPECAQVKYVKDINRDALYEYACFFLNTMGGRLYLFRRDSQSRMVVTYYGILLVDLANRQQNNRHGIDLKPAVNMLISEMETGGSNLKNTEEYLDKLYDLKEKHQ